MNLDEAISQALNGKAILFAGSGFSSHSINQSGKKFKRGGELCSLLCDNLNIDYYNDLGYISKKYIEAKGEENLIRLLQNEYICKSVQDEHRNIAKVNWKRIYTTNYDNVIEIASSEVGNARIPITLSKKPNLCVNSNNLIIHLNGYIEDLTPEKLYSEFKLSRDSYINDDFTNSDWLMLFKQDLENAKAIFFVGFSLDYDIELQRMMVKTDDLWNKCFFITQKDINTVSSDNMKDYGQLFNIEVKGFSEEIAKISKDFIPITSVDDFECFDYLNKHSYDSENLVDNDIFELLIKGNIKLTHLINNVGKEKYFVNRTSKDSIITGLKDRLKLIVIHSDLGNGKTCIINSLIAGLIKESHVFLLKKHNENLNDELEKVSKKEGIKYIIIEDYNLYLNQMKLLRLYKSNNIKLIFTARSFINDVFYLQLLESLDIDDDEVGLYEVNELDSDEINSLIDIFDEYHLWGDNSTLSFYNKRKIIHKIYKSKFQNILLGLLESEFIDSKLDDILGIITSNKDIEEIVLTSFINSILNLNLNLEDIIILLDKVLISAKISRNAQLKELIDIKQNKVLVKSSILAQHIIRNKNLTNKVIDILIKIMVSADKKNFCNRYHSMLRLLISFSNAILLLKGNNTSLSNNIIKYYENIKNLNFNKNNPFFWLQYAIARLEIKDFPAAKTYFKNAYAYADQMDNFDTYQLDSHFARYLLESQLNSNCFEDSFDRFIEAHKLIYNNGNKPEHLHYPLRHTRYYFDYYQKFYQHFNDFQKTKFYFCCKQIIEKIDNYNAAIKRMNRPKHPDVKIAEKSIYQIINQLSLDNKNSKIN